MLRRLFRPSALQLPLRAARSLPNGQVVTVYKAKVHKFVDIKRVAFWTATYAIAFCVTRVVFLIASGKLVDELDDMTRELDKLGLLDDEEESDKESDPKQEKLSIFLPCPFWLRRVPAPRYSKDSPELQRLRRLGHDKQDQITKALLDFIHDGMPRFRDIREEGGVVKLELGNVSRHLPVLQIWDGYEKVGIQITPADFLAPDRRGIVQASRPIDYLAAQRWEQIIYPKPIGLAMWALVSSACRESWTQLKSLHVWDSKDSKTTADTPQNTIRVGGKGPPVVTVYPRDSAQATHQITSSPNPSASRSRDDSAPKTARKDDQDSPQRPPWPSFRSQDLLPSGPLHDAIIKKPIKEFETALRNNLRSYSDNPPRGCLPVSCYATVTTSKCIRKVHVLGFWDPRTENIDMGSVIYKLVSEHRR